MINIKKTTYCIIIITMILLVGILSVSHAVENFYSQQIKNSIWDIERRLKQNPSDGLKEELFRLRKKYLSELKNDIEKISTEIISVNNNREKSNLIRTLSLLKKDYRKYLKLNIEFLENIQNNKTDMSVTEQIEELKEKMPDYNILCFDKEVERSTLFFGKKEDDQYSCQGKLIAEYKLSKSMSGLGSDATIAKKTDTHLTVHWWANAFSSIKYRIKIWVHDAK